MSSTRRGGTSWSWQSCEGERCLNIVYGDSLSAISNDSFKYSGDKRYPTVAADMLASIETIAAASCDILNSVHPEVADLWSSFDERQSRLRAARRFVRVQALRGGGQEGIG